MDRIELGSLLLSFSCQVANGMEYLHLKGYIHRDLAARNVLLSKDNICKIADFGLSRALQNEDHYLSKGGKVPVKWTAPEALNYRKYSPASDAWSYGCVLYEIWSLGVKPYEKLTNKQVRLQLDDGYRLPPPPGCPRDVYLVMIKSWHTDPESRPKFIDVITMLNKPEFKVLKWNPEDIASYDEKFRTIGSFTEDDNNTNAITLYSDLQNTYRKVL